MGTPSISDAEKAQIRAVVFGHLAGVVLAPTVKALWDRRVFDLFEAGDEWVELDHVLDQTRANRGYLRAALRLLSSCGWLRQRVEHGRPPCYSLTHEGKIALSMAPLLYGEVLSFVSKAIFLEDFLFGESDRPMLPSLQELVRRSKEQWGLQPQSDPVAEQVRNQICRHLDGMIIGPTMVALARGGILAQLEQGPVDVNSISANRASFAYILDLLAAQGWIVRDKNTVSLTPCGRYAAQIATSYGVTISYLPLFDNLSTLLFGNARISRLDESGVELLVNRGMNVWGSGGAHRTYFKKVDEIIIEIFNRSLNLQPRGICDMGCGDATFLEHLYFVVKNHTVRGQVLDKDPLVLVGADFNKVARRVAKQTLRKAGIPVYHVISGDINRPAQLASDLEALDLDIHDLLHVRSFLDHNRPYIPPANYASGARPGRSTGAFAHLGEEIPCDELEENLVRHLRRWAPYVGRFGLLVLELHTLPPEVTAKHLEHTPAVAYDGTHGFSDQYLVELPLFLDCAREAGLWADERHQCKFPPSELATVSINFFRTEVWESP
ncbi:MAG: class I SAM-dependent methyltransferase [Acidobacteriia bacterium]|nr:class I SAM-dependent methyltransferase [Terriglobia bacterium]